MLRYLFLHRRTFTVALRFVRPGVRVQLRATKPEILAERRDTLGAHLRRRLRELGMTRADAATILGADYKTLMWWELDEREPFAHCYPAIVNFLGFEPWPRPITPGDHLKV